MTVLTVPREILCKSALNKTGIPGYAYCLNPYVGCVHGCVYCYASFMCRFTGHQDQWGEFLDVKINFPEVLASQLRRRRTPPAGKILVGTVTDAYQPAEKHYELTRASLQLLAEYPLLEVHILTKSALVLRDLPLLRQLRACEVGFTITTMEEAVARIIEPHASPPALRLAAAKELQEAGIPVWVFIAPLLPGLTDTEEALVALLQALQAAGIKEILLDYLNAYPAVVHRLHEVYRRHFPGAAPALTAYLRQPGLYRAELADRLRRLGGSLGCRPYFV